MRLFIGIFPPKEILDTLRDISREYSKQKNNLKFLPIDQLHINVKFIGPSVSEQSKNAIIDDFERFKGTFGSFEVKIKDIKYGFRKDTFPKYLVANVEQNPNLENISKILHQGVKDLRFDDTILWRERYVNDFHITLAKLKSTATSSTAKQIKRLTESLNIQDIPAFKVEYLFFVESYYIRGKGPFYRKLHSIRI